MTIGSWFNAHKKNVLAHSLILSGFLLFMIFAAVPLFDKLERFPGEGEAQREGEAQLYKLPLPAETNGIRYFIDSISIVGQKFLDMEGWAFIEDTHAENSTIYVILKSTNSTLIFGAEGIMRPDVTGHFKELNLNLNNSGFLARIPMRILSAGRYTVGLYIRKNGMEKLQYTHKAILKSNGAVQIIPR